MTAQQAATTHRQDPCIDSSQIDGLVDAAGREGALEILDAFWRSTQSLLASLRAQLAAADAAEASRTAHALKGSALNVGATRLSRMARAIEDRCRSNDPAGALAMMDCADRSYAETVAAFETHLGPAR